jgi:hypothetical protein
MRITAIREIILPIGSGIRNAYIDFSRMTISLVAVITDVICDSRTVIGYGFKSNVRYGQGGLIRDRFAPGSLEVADHSLVNDAGDNFDPNSVCACMMSNEKPGGHGERSVAVGTLTMAIWTS